MTYEYHNLKFYFQHMHFGCTGVYLDLIYIRIHCYIKWKSTSKL